MVKILVFQDVSKTYDLGLGKKKLPVLFDVSFSVNRGEVFGFVGPNGAGKSTTIKLILNLIFPDKGRIEVFGKNPNDVEIKKKIGYLPEIPYYYDYLTPYELAWFSGKIAGLDDALIKKRAEELFTYFLFEAHAKKRIRELSKGNAQKAGIIATLIHSPEFLILDEPMTGLDPIGRKLVGDMILKLKEEGKTIFLTSHILSDVERYCDSIAIIYEGRIKFFERKENLLKSGESLEDIFCDVIGLKRMQDVK
jgi:ABC-2 type transport system ATP-binding protein